MAVLVAAAGSGSRLGLGPKAFVQVGGKSLLEWTVEAWEGRADQLIVAVPAVAVERARAMLPSVDVVAGGNDRQQTVALLLEATQAEYVLVHDAARPFLPGAVADRVLKAAQEGGAATAALPVADTLVDMHTGRTVPRERLWAVQTPQGFRRTLLLEAHARASAEALGATDDASLVRRLGHRVTLVEGSPLLHKLTTRADLDLAIALLAQWRSLQTTDR